jgi:putative endonuclease
MSYFIYIMASRRKGTLYIGVTNNLVQRSYAHRNSLIDGFTKTHNIRKLVYWEQLDSAELAITREKKMKKWLRKWKIELIEQFNPDWRDLYDTLK